MLPSLKALECILKIYFKVCLLHEHRVITHDYIPLHYRIHSAVGCCEAQYHCNDAPLHVDGDIGSHTVGKKVICVRKQSSCSVYHMLGDSISPCRKGKSLCELYLFITRVDDI